MLDSPIAAVIEDDEAVRLAHSSLIRSLGWGVRQYGSADDFLQSLQPVDVACVVSDVQMPGITGLEMLRHLNRQGRNLPVIFITGFPNETMRQQALQEGAKCWLIKPVDATELAHYLDEIMRGR
ncbi:MAG: response regulator [Paraburkholderia sp.]|uniref:response regulator n=1 Tax=Burkholderiaceae TaxID=119060 RepID=UPI0010F654A9|nr:response regulator [Burkholderia sp. 4M9327F10]